MAIASLESTGAPRIACVQVPIEPGFGAIASPTVKYQRNLTVVVPIVNVKGVATLKGALHASGLALTTDRLKTRHGDERRSGEEQKAAIGSLASWHKPLCVTLLSPGSHEWGGSLHAPQLAVDAALASSIIFSPKFEPATEVGCYCCCFS